jgi:hypothetical protein
MLLTFFFFTGKGQESGVRKVTIKATNTFSNCEGVAWTPAPIRNSMLFVRRGRVNDVDQKIVAAGKTDTSGTVVFTLDTGTYVIIGKSKIDTKLYDGYLKRYKYKTELYSPVDKECLIQWLAEPMGVITVKAGGPITFSINVNERCDWESPPCVNYYGPTPR